MKIPRHFTKKGEGPYKSIKFENRVSEIRNPDGTVIFRQEDVRVPSSWSQIATDILAQKYFRRTGVPLKNKRLGGETTAEQVFHRLAYTWMDWGRKHKYFDADEDADNFYDELRYMLAHQMAAPNSPQWFNTGLFAVYGIKGPAQGHYYVDSKTKKIEQSTSAYERPQPHACFILNVDDSLVKKGGIMDLVTREARIFKYGSGTGSNFSDIRGKNEPLSGGGYSSGLLSFLKVNDRSASAIKSGGTTRRAAKMVTLDVDHPDLEEYVDWKVEEEYKVASMVTGSKLLKKHTDIILAACKSSNGTLEQNLFNPLKNTKLKEAIQNAIMDEVPTNFIYRTIQLARQNVNDFLKPEYNTEWDTEAYNTVSGQCSNNSIRITQDFMKAVIDDEEWALKWRTNGEVSKKIKAKELWDKIALNAWHCADPGIQFHSTINEWHTCLADGEIRASNPCSEYMFLDDTACNLASLNLMKFYDAEKKKFKLKDFKHAVRLWSIVLEISVLMAQFPSQEIAQKSYDYRTLGLGFANLGAMLMVMGIPYDSVEGRTIAGAISAVMTGKAYAASAEMAADLTPFNRYNANKEHMLRVIRNHRRAAYNAGPEEYEGLSVTPIGIDPESCPEELVQAAKEAWDDALKSGSEHGYRNAQVTAIAPTGTIGLIMDCDTTGIEPDYALVKYKKLAGGGYFKIINQSIPDALLRLGYSKEQTIDIVKYCMGTGTLKDAPGVSYEILKKRGFTEKVLKKIENVISSSFYLGFVMNVHTVGKEFVTNILKVPEAEQQKPEFNLLKYLKFTDKEIDEANRYACGTMTIEGAPHLKKEHYTVFDTANKCGVVGKRYIAWKAHIDIMASVQPFISGAISKTINMDNSSKVEDIKGAYFHAWKVMLKSIAIYRDGSKLSQPLSSLIPGSDAVADAILYMSKNKDGRSLKPVPDSGSIKKRNLLPGRREGYTQKAKIGGHSLFVRTGNYKDGTLGEIFLDMHKEGAAFRSLLNSFAIAVSLGLQYGVPLEEYVDAFTFTRFAPNGIVRGHDNIKMSTSVLDFIFRDLALSYLKRTDLVQVKPEDLISTGTSEDVKDEQQEEDVQNIDENDKVKIARFHGYEGDPCPSCGHFTLVRNGTCFKCETCGSTTGCS